MKSKLVVCILALAAFGAPCFAGAVQLTGSLSADFLSGPSAGDIIDTFSLGGQPVFWGVGGEVVLHRVGFGGDYMVSFFQSPEGAWWLDWYAPALFVSFHPIGVNRFIDPFFDAGFGCAGRVFLGPATSYWPLSATGLPSISLFPFVAGGISLNLDGFLLKAKATYTPFVTPIPVTILPAYPLGEVQVAITAGFSINW